MINNNEELKKSLSKALENVKPFSFKLIVDFTEEEIKDLGHDQIVEKIFEKIRPDTSSMEISEIEGLSNNIPDWMVDNGLIDHFEIEFIEKSEQTFEPRYIISLYTNKTYDDYMNKYYEE